MRGDDMDIAKSIRDLRESTGMSRKDFSEHTGIPVRTLEDWEAGRRTPPEYIPRLIAYQLKYEELVILKELLNNPSITQKELAGIIGKSERTIKTRTVEMKKKD
jgi:DNA-binding XRE family transcriptional regulator